NKEKLSELARTSLNEHCLAVLLKKLPKKLGDPGKFLIPCDFPGMDECLALADLEASINLMPLSVWNKLSLPELSPTCMNLELADRSISRSVEVAKDVFVKVGTFHFLTDFVVVDFDADPRVPLILRRSFLKTGRALIDVFKGELTLRVGKEAITFNLDQTLRYLANYNDMMVNRIDIIDMACEEYSQEVLGFSDVIASGNPTPYYDPIASTSSSTLTPFKDSDFLLEEVKAFLALEDDLTSPEVDHSYYDTEGDILLLKAFLNDDPSLPPPNQGNPVHCVPKKGGFTVVKNEENELIPTRLVTRWHVCIDNHQEKTTFTCPYETFAYRRMPFGLCNAPGTFQRNSFRTCLSHLEKMLKRCEDTNLCLNWEKSHIMVKEGIVPSHKISKNEIEVDKAKVDYNLFVDFWCMSTRSSARNLFPPLDNPELKNRRRSRADPTLLNDFEIVAEGNGDLPVPDLRTMEELCQPSLNGRGGPIASISIQAMNFGLKNDMIQQVPNSCQFHGLPGDDAKKHLDKFLHVTQSIKVHGVTDDALRLYLFPHSLTHHATAWFDRLPRNSINIFEQMAKMIIGKYFPPSMVTKLINEITNFRQRPDESLFEAWECYKLLIDRCGTFMKKRFEDCYDLIENMTAHHNDWDTLAQRSESSSSITSSFDTKITALKAEMAKINKNLMRVLQVNQQVKVVTPICETCGGPHSYNDCPTTVGQTQNENDAILKNMQTNMTSLTSLNLDLKNMFGQFIKMNTASSSGSGTLPGNTITNLKEDLKGITTRSGTAYQRPTIHTTSSSLPQVVERETKVTKDTVHPTNNGSTKDVQPSVVQTKTPILNSEPVVAPIIEPIVAPVNALILMPKFSPTIKTLLTNKYKLSELARTPLNENCSTFLLKKLPEKLGDPDKFLIPCDFPRMDECLALADLDASINLMPLSVWNKFSLPELSPTCMTLELVDCLIYHPVGVAEDVFVKVGTFHFPADFVAVDFDADPRVPLILGRSFLQTERALIDVFEGELTLRVGKEAITFNLDQTSRYSANYNDMTVNRIDVIDMACEEYSKEVLGFSNVIASGNPTPYYDPIVSTSSPTLTPFGDSDFLLEEVDAFLALEDDPTSPKVDHSYIETGLDILLL
nr:reverse transcriptase domain-containing protein [Tanacetum cinerariifolium]